MTVHDFYPTEEIGTDLKLKLQDNTANAYTIGTATETYLSIDTTIGCETIMISNACPVSNIEVIIGGQNINTLADRVRDLENDMPIHSALPQSDLHEPKRTSVEQIIRDMVPELMNLIESQQIEDFGKSTITCRWCSESSSTSEDHCIHCGQTFQATKTWASK